MREVRAGGVEAGGGVGEELVVAEIEIALGVGHAGGVGVADGGDFGVRVVVSHAEEVAHVEVVEVDTGDFPAFGHGMGE
jgi:hypothetical protein